MPLFVEIPLFYPLKVAMTAIPLMEMAVHQSARPRLVLSAHLQIVLEETALPFVEIL